MTQSINELRNELRSTISLITAMQRSETDQEKVLLFSLVLRRLAAVEVGLNDKRDQME